MDIRRPVLPIAGAETIPKVQASIPDRQRQSSPLDRREKKKRFPRPDEGGRGAADEDDGPDAAPEAPVKGRSIEAVVDGVDGDEEEKVHGSRVDVHA